MILFYDDWAKYPNAIVHTTTNNKTFVRLAGVYKSMGIKNHAFLLALHDPTLADVDPFDPNISKENIGRISIECKRNPWYFFREIARASPIASSNGVPIRANRGNMSLYWLFFCHITTFLIQPRQTGKSFSTGVLFRYLLNIGSENSKMNLLTKDNKLRVSTLDVMKGLNKELPLYLRMTGKSDSDNTEEITVNALGNKLRTHLAQVSPKAARNVGRGLTSPIFHIDELPHLYNIDITLPAALASGGAARDEAELNNSPYGTIFTTTPARLDTDSGRYGYKLLKSGAKWTEKMLDCSNLDELKEMIMKNSSNDKLMVSLEFNHRQLGYTDAWLKGKLDDALSEGEDAETDYLNIWSSGTNTNPINKEYLKVMRDNVKIEYTPEISNLGYILRWYVTADQIPSIKKNNHVIISLDTSDAVGKDDIALTIRDVKTGAILAVGNYNETNLLTFAKWLFEWSNDFMKAVILIERKSSGVVMLDYLIENMLANNVDPFRRLFNWVVEEHQLYPERYNEINLPFKSINKNLYIKHRKHFGYATSGSGRSARDNLYGGTLLSAVKYTSNVVYDKELVDQLTSLTSRNGRIDHSVDGKDDLCISWLLGYWFLLNGKNMQHYGIPPRTIMSNVNSDTLKLDKETEEKNKIQNEIRAKIEALIEFLKVEKNPHTGLLIINRIKMLAKDLDDNLTQAFNITTMLEDLELDRAMMKKIKSIT